MPEICRFYGLIVKMIFSDDDKHHKPHVHVYYGEYAASVALDGEVLDGRLPVKQYRMLTGWMAIHEDELNANWKMLSEGEGYFKIAPLN